MSPHLAVSRKCFNVSDLLELTIVLITSGGYERLYEFINLLASESEEIYTAKFETYFSEFLVASSEAFPGE